MSHNAIMYDVEPHIAEIYDQVETSSDDVELVRRLVGDRKPLRILEPFCGTGRILIPLARDGHTLVGLDQAHGMLARAQVKIGQLPKEVQRRITLIGADVTSSDWPRGFDVVILGGNCFYELATPEEQERCIISAAAALIPGGHVYIDNDHMEGELDPAWQTSGVRRGFPTGTCADGTRVESTTETVWFDMPRRLAKFHRCTTVVRAEGNVIKREYEQQKHPVSQAEVQMWLEAHKFNVGQLYGDHAGNAYTATSDRAIFWASLPEFKQAKQFEINGQLDAELKYSRPKV